MYTRRMDTLDPDLLARARSTLERVAALEKELDAAKADVRHAVRRLQLAGGSVRAIGKALGMSHQRVQQLVESVDDGKGWKRRGRSAGPMVCTFCGRPDHEVAKLIAGPNVYICDACVADVGAAAQSEGSTPWTSSTKACSFCGKHSTPRSRRGHACICRECQGLCEEILANDSTATPRG